METNLNRQRLTKIKLWLEGGGGVMGEGAVGLNQCYQAVETTAVV